MQSTGLAEERQLRVQAEEKATRYQSLRVQKHHDDWLGDRLTETWNQLSGEFKSAKMLLEQKVLAEQDARDKVFGSF